MDAKVQSSIARTRLSSRFDYRTRGNFSVSGIRLLKAQPLRQFFRISAFESPASPLAALRVTAAFRFCPLPSVLCPLSSDLGPPTSAPASSVRQRKLVKIRCLTTIPILLCPLRPALARPRNGNNSVTHVSLPMASNGRKFIAVRRRPKRSHTYLVRSNS